MEREREGGRERERNRKSESEREREGERERERERERENFASQMGYIENVTSANDLQVPHTRSHTQALTHLERPRTKVKKKCLN